MRVQYKYILWIQSLIQVLTVSLLNCISGYIVPSYNDNHHTLHDTLTQIPPLYIIIYTPTLHITYPKRHPYTSHTLNATPTHHIPYTQALHMVIPETPALHIPAPKHHICNLHDSPTLHHPLHATSTHHRHLHATPIPHRTLRATPTPWGRYQM